MKNKTERAAVLIPLRPRFAEAILRGEKTIECRKTSIQLTESRRYLSASQLEQLGL